MPFYLFARKVDGPWLFMMKIWTQQQVDFHSGFLLKKRNMINALDVDAPLLYSDTLVCEELPSIYQIPWTDSEKGQIFAKLEALNER
jgi:hypothetical protein